LTWNVPEFKNTTCPAGQAARAALIAAVSSPPLGDSVEQMVVRLGIPPLDVIPGFQAKFLSAGIIGPPGGGGGGGGGFARRIISFWAGEIASAPPIAMAPAKIIPKIIPSFFKLPSMLEDFHRFVR
jgi:hypothetical protein